MIPLFKVLMNEDQNILTKTLQSGYVAQGPRVEEFEKELKEYFGAEVLTINSCTSALDLALHLAGVGSGDEVVTTPITCSATNSVIVNRGARPVWADVDPYTGNIMWQDIERKITPRTKAIMCVDWSGRPCDYDEIKKIVGIIPVIEDAAHSFGATYKGKPIATCNSNMIAWSFQAIKHLNTGDGGALKVPKYHHERARLLRWYGLSRDVSDSFRCAQDIKEVGYKYHMNDVAASIGLANLELAKKEVSFRQSTALIYQSELRGVRSIQLPPPSEDSSWWFYPLIIHSPHEGGPKSFQGFMKDRGIATNPVHARNDEHTAFNYPNGPLPNTDFYNKRHMALPTGSWLTGSDLNLIIQSVKEWDRA